MNFYGKKKVTVVFKRDVKGCSLIGASQYIIELLNLNLVRRSFVSN